MTNYGLVAGICFGLAFGIIYAWASHVIVEQKHTKEIEEIVGDLNAYRVMAEWDEPLRASLMAALRLR